MVKDHNKIQIRVSEFSAQELRENFEMDFCYVDYLGQLRDKSKELIPKSSTVQDYLVYLREKYLDFLKGDFDELRNKVGLEEEFSQSGIELKITGFAINVHNNAFHIKTLVPSNKYPLQSSISEVRDQHYGIFALPSIRLSFGAENSNT